MLPAPSPFPPDAPRAPARRWKAATGRRPVLLFGVPLLQRAFAPCEPEAGTLERLAAALRLHVLPKGSVPAVNATQPPSWWLVAEGRVVMGRPGPDGSLVENRILGPGQWLDLTSAWLDTGWLESAVCPTRVALAALPLQALLDEARRDPVLQQAMGMAMAGRIRELTEGRHELATKDVLARLAGWLLREPFEPQGEGRVVRLPVQKRSIARQLVMAQATLSRCFRRLVALGCVEMDGYLVLIRDVPALQALAGDPVAT